MVLEKVKQAYSDAECDIRKNVHTNEYPNKFVQKIDMNECPNKYSY